MNYSLPPRQYHSVIPPYEMAWSDCFARSRVHQLRYRSDRFHTGRRVHSIEQFNEKTSVNENKTCIAFGKMLLIVVVALFINVYSNDVSVACISFNFFFIVIVLCCGSSFTFIHIVYRVCLGVFLSVYYKNLFTKSVRSSTAQIGSKLESHIVCMCSRASGSIELISQSINHILSGCVEIRVFH